MPNIKHLIDSVVSFEDKISQSRIGCDYLQLSIALPVIHIEWDVFMIGWI